MRNKRYGRGYAGNRRNTPKPSYFPVILILCISVGCGYAAAKYVVDPVVNYVPQISQKVSEKQTDKDTKKAEEELSTSAKEGSQIVTDEVTTKKAGNIRGYAVQLGCYSDRKAAENAMKQVNAEGLQVVEQNSLYKVIGKVCRTREDARDTLKEMPEGTSGFVTEVYE